MVSSNDNFEPLEGKNVNISKTSIVPSSFKEHKDIIKRPSEPSKFVEMARAHRRTVDFLTRTYELTTIKSVAQLLLIQVDSHNRLSLAWIEELKLYRKKPIGTDLSKERKRPLLPWRHTTTQPVVLSEQRLENLYTTSNEIALLNLNARNSAVSARVITENLIRLSAITFRSVLREATGKSSKIPENERTEAQESQQIMVNQNGMRAVTSSQSVTNRVTGNKIYMRHTQIPQHMFENYSPSYEEIVSSLGPIIEM